MKKNCLICNGIYNVKPSHSDKSFCCSKECSRAYPMYKLVKKIEEAIKEPLSDFLRREYVENKRSFRWLVSELEINNRTISKLLKKYNIEIRRGSEAVKTQWINNDERKKETAELMYRIKELIPHPRYLTEEEIKARCAQTDFEFISRIKADKEKVKIKCKGCGIERTVTPDILLRERNCAVCFGSTGERQIFTLLEERGAKVERQFKFKECRLKRPLPFDFAVFDDSGKLQFLIEYDGKQHFNPEAGFGRKDTFSRIRITDTIKTAFCIREGIPLLRIPYTEKENIETILSNTFRLLA